MSEQLLLTYTPDIIDHSYGNLPEHLKKISLPIDDYRKKGCQWRINGQQCREKCVASIFYCDAHKDIPDIKRHEPITTCRKRK